MAFGTFWCIRVPPGSFWRILVHSGASGCLLMHSMSAPPLRGGEGWLRPWLCFWEDRNARAQPLGHLATWPLSQSGAQPLGQSATQQLSRYGSPDPRKIVNYSADQK